MLKPTQEVPLRIGDELLEPGLPTHVRTYVGPLGPYGEDVLDAPKNGVGQLIHFSQIKNRFRLASVALNLGRSNRPFGNVPFKLLGHPEPDLLVLTVNTFHSYVRVGKAESPQLAGFAVVGVLVAGIIAVTR